MGNTRSLLSMKKKYGEDFSVVRFEQPEEFLQSGRFDYPFETGMLRLLKQENSLQQEYITVRAATDYASFILYHNYMNIFTLGKLKMNYPVQVIGYPCSLSDAGYQTNSKDMMLDAIKTMKGGFLILNADEPITRKDYVVGETLPTCVLSLINPATGCLFSSTEEYLNQMRSPYRRRIRQAMDACASVEISENVKDKAIHELYLNTYEKSDYKLERLEAGFFENVDAVPFVFYKDHKPVGFVLLKGIGDKLEFMLCGMDYSEDTTDLYYFMLLKIVSYGIEHRYQSIDLGQTSEETKMKFGAKLQKKYFYAYNSNPLLNIFIHVGSSLLEYHYHFPKYRVFKETKE